MVCSNRKQEGNIVWCIYHGCLYQGVYIRVHVPQSGCLGSYPGVAVSHCLCTQLVSLSSRNLYYQGQIHALSQWVELPMISAGVPLAYTWVHFLLGEEVLAQSFKSGFLTEPCIMFLHSFPNIKDDTRQWYWQDLLTQMLLVV